MKQAFTREEIINAVKFLLNNSNSTTKDEWYTTDYTFTRYGIDQLLDALDIKQEEIE